MHEQLFIILQICRRTKYEFLQSTTYQFKETTVSHIVHGKAWRVTHVKRSESPPTYLIYIFVQDKFIYSHGSKYLSNTDLYNFCISSPDFFIEYRIHAPSCFRNCISWWGNSERFWDSLPKYSFPGIWGNLLHWFKKKKKKEVKRKICKK